MLVPAIALLPLLLSAPPITAHAPAYVQIDDRLPVYGRALVAGAPRTVRLQERTATGEWFQLAAHRTRASGRYRFSVPSGHALTERTLRVVAAPSHGLRRAHTPPFVVDVVVSVAGSGRDQQSRGSRPTA